MCKISATRHVGQALRNTLAASPPTPSYIGRSEAARSVRDLVARVADSMSTVLVTGESGTGKELVARALHDESVRRAGNFVPINCAAIPKDLLESELFGHRKGAFTGASADRIGRFELAHGGTIFLDEIGDLSLDMQVKLLRVLQERTIDPVGGLKSVSVNVRVVAATHRDLEAEIEAGRFREDLYYRLNVLPLSTAPLRERTEDVPELLAFFAKRFAGKSRAPISFTPDFMSALQAYAWPGNVRELSNLVDRFTTLFTSQSLALDTVPAKLLPKGLAALQAERCQNAPSRTLRQALEQRQSNSADLAEALGIAPPLAEDTSAYPALAASAAHALASASSSAPAVTAFPSFASGTSAADAAEPAPSLAQDDSSNVEDIIMLAQGMPVLPPNGVSLKDRLADIERDLISQALTRTDGNVSQTARLLSLQRTTLIEKIHKYSLRPTGPVNAANEASLAA